MEEASAKTQRWAEMTEEDGRPWRTGKSARQRSPFFPGTKKARLRSRDECNKASSNLTARVVPRLAICLELFAGAASLSAAVEERSPTAHLMRAADTWRDAEQNLSKDDFLHCCAGVATRAFWLHQAPPCRTFTKSRRSEKWATVKKLRSDETPGGFGCQQTEEANELARRAVFLARKTMQ